MYADYCSLFSGHGKLIMKDGTYYEGQFVNGEINGNGYKYSAHAQSKYTGQFLDGEMHGDGCMVYKNDSVYDGQWYRNKRQGQFLCLYIYSCVQLTGSLP